MIAVWLFSFLAAAFWFVLFSPWTSGLIMFWPMMTAATGILALIGFFAQDQRSEICRFRPWHVAAGIGSAGLLYGAFYIGRYILVRIFPASAAEIQSVYAIREGVPVGVILCLLLFWIGPAEEIFWRGFVQRRCVKHFGPWKGVAFAALIYAAVHVWSFNLTLFLAAGACGLWWGVQFLMFRSLWPVIISHALWDVAIFILWPMSS